MNNIFRGVIRLCNASISVIFFYLPDFIFRLPPIIIEGQKLNNRLQLLIAVRKRLQPNLMKPTEMRRHYRRSTVMKPFRYSRGVLTEEHRIQLKDGSFITARLYTSKNCHHGKGDIILYFHGGFYCSGDLDTHDEFCRLLSISGHAPVLSVAYRLAPEAPFPAAIEDSLAAWHWLLDQQQILGINADRITVAGDSSGGTLANVLALHLAHSTHKPCCQLLIYAGCDRSVSYPSYRLFADRFLIKAEQRNISYEYYLPATEPGNGRLDWRLSPALYENLSKNPSTIMVYAGFDQLRDEQQEYLKNLRTADVDCLELFFPELCHGFISLSHWLPAAKQAVRHLGQQWRQYAAADFRSSQAITAEIEQTH